MIVDNVIPSSIADEIGIEKGDEVDLIFFNDMAWPSL